MSSSPPAVLAFAASDPTGGAGLQADVLTIASLGCHPLSVLTGLTVQDTRGVESLLAMEPAWVASQARGVLGSAANIGAIAELARAYPDIPLILDPVLASGRGDALASEEMVRALREQIVPCSTIVTPNSLEAQRLGGAHALLDLGCDYVLVTGTHQPGAEVINTLHGKAGIIRQDRWPRLPGTYHGSGCTLASAIAAFIAKGLDVAHAVRNAQEFTWNALRGGFKPGAGQLLPDRFFSAREAKVRK